MEADYAIRILYYLTLHKGRTDARTIASEMGITLRFALKILRKLAMEGIVKSYKGVTGGYQLNVNPSDITLCKIIETIDGPICINKCLHEEITCSRLDDKIDCPFHNQFKHINTIIKEELDKVNFSDVVPLDKDQ